MSAGGPHGIDAVPAWRPPWWLALRELLSLWRAALSLLPVPAQPPGGGRAAAVVLVPGFLAGDWSLRPAARHLRRRGFRTHRSGIRLNAGCTSDLVDRLERRVAAVAAAEGPVALVGHSRGGTLARLVAARRPDLVRQVVTLGSPLTHQLAASERVLGVAEAIARRNRRHSPLWLDDDCLRGACAERTGLALAAPLPTEVRLTSVHTRGDGIVVWSSCVAPGAVPVRVRGSHNGLASSRSGLRAVVRALAPVTTFPVPPVHDTDTTGAPRPTPQEENTMNLAGNLRHTAVSHPTRVAVRLDEHETTYRELAGAAARVAGWLRTMGVQPGDRVGVLLPNLPSMPVVYYGILWAGAVVVPMNPLFKAREIGYALADSGAAVLFAWDAATEEAAKGAADAGALHVPVGPGFADEVARHQPISLEVRHAADTAVVLYTSGTTGSPKGAELTHSNMRRNAEACRGFLGLTEQSVVFGGLPLFHSFGQTVCMNTGFLVGATLTLLPRFEPGAALEVIQRDEVTLVGAVPTMYVALLQHPDRARFDTSTLELCVSGGASLPVEVLHGFEEAYGAPILEGYGLSETSPVASFNHPDRERKAGSVGQPIEGVEFRLVDEDWNDTPEGEVGEIAIRGHNVMKGYLNKPSATAQVLQDGWFRTGDLARRDEDGYYFIVDRAKDMIIRGGYNVYPREIEEVLYEHPAVGSVAVIGVPHETHGEEIAAAVVLKDGAAATPEELRDYVRERVAAYKYPRIVWLTDALPLGATGKILKREITVPADVAGA
ncbi:hypothetical protein GCM10009623_22780 [Nocardioides aestuarii]|uniref:Alpha/beta fold hydrolase n=1 Tax=Nocardioides aestuarii TaxID=252231 RepID=A0ABW4TNB1_9ACTN